MTDAKTLSGSGSAEDSSPGLPPSKRKRKRQSVLVACNICRRRKARCDGRRPTCRACEKSGSICRYDVDEGETRAGAQSKKVLNLEEENAALRRLVADLRQRLATSPDTPLSSISAASSRSPRYTELHVSPLIQAGLPSWLSAVECELILSHSNAYAYKDLPDLATLKATHAANIRSIFGDGLLSQRQRHSHIDAETDGVTPWSSDDRKSLRALRPQPSPPPKYKDKRLGHVDWIAWCPMTVPPELARCLIEFYLVMDHPILGLFDIDLFIDDLMCLRTRFCSSLLVTSILLWACHGYTIFDQRAHLLKDLLYTEAVRQWNHDCHADSITTATAGVLINMTSHINGDDDVGSKVLRELHDMIHRLELYGLTNGQPNIPNDLNGAEGQWLRAGAHAAWGIFNYVTINVFNYGTPIMRRPPKFAIPGDAHTWTLTEHMGNTFTRLCKLLLVLNEVALAYFADHDRLAGSISLDFADTQYRRLLEWAAMDGPLIDKWNNSPHHACYVQIIFHAGILDIFRPFLGVDVPLRSFQRPHYTARSIFTASYKQLSYQILIYPLIHPPQTFIWWFSGINQVANATMTTIDEDSNSMQMFLLCLLSLYDLSKCFPVMEHVVRGLLLIATRKGIVTSSVARNHYEQIRRGTRPKVSTNQTGTGFVVDLSQAQRVSDSASVSQLTKDFEDVIINVSD